MARKIMLLAAITFISTVQNANAITTSSPNIKIHYQDYANSKIPKGTKVYVCHGSGCEWQVPFRFSASDIQHFKQIFSATANARDERKGIARAVAWSERRVCKTAGTCNDKAGASWATSKVRGQLECVDESVNTTSYLMVMSRFLKHCKVTTPIHRYGFGTFPHWAARITCNDGTFVIDSYFRANGQNPDVMPVGKWSK